MSGHYLRFMPCVLIKETAEYSIWINLYKLVKKPLKTKFEEVWLCMRLDGVSAGGAHGQGCIGRGSGRVAQDVCRYRRPRAEDQRPPGAPDSRPWYGTELNNADSRTVSAHKHARKLM